MATSRDVARMAEVSVATVSRAFHTPELVVPETREKIFHVAKQLNYSPNYVARSLKSSKSDTIGLLISDIQNPFYMFITQILQQELNSQHYRLLISFSDEDLKKEEENIKPLLSSRIEGLLFTPAGINPRLPDMLASNHVYGLQLYRRAYSQMDSLVVDDACGTYLAAMYLLKHNHRRILLIDGDVPIPTQREDGYSQAFRESGLVPDSAMIVRIPLVRACDGEIYNAIVEKKPTAIICVSNNFSLSMLSALKKLNLSVPDDMSVIVYDEQPWAELLDITTIGHHVDELGSIVSRIMLNRLKNGMEDGARNYMVKPKLNERNSVRTI